jgi:hypothetical protein
MEVENKYYRHPLVNSALDIPVYDIYSSSELCVPDILIAHIVVILHMPIRKKV